MERDREGMREIYTEIQLSRGKLIRIEGERYRERGRKKETDRDRETDRGRYRETGRDTERRGERQIEKKRDRETETDRQRQTETEKDRLIGPGKRYINIININVYCL